MGNTLTPLSVHRVLVCQLDISFRFQPFLVQKIYFGKILCRFNFFPILVVLCVHWQFG
jgi:hypothetical protein